MPARPNRLPSGVIAVSLTTAAFLGSAGCSVWEGMGLSAAATPPKSPTAPPKSSTVLTRPGTGARLDPITAEWGTPRTPARTSDPVIASVDGAPVSSAPTGNPDDATSADGMESLAQVTFAAQGSDFDPCVSRDGKWIVYASTQHRPTADIYIKSVNGRTVTQLTADPAQDVMPAFSPDGKRIAFCSNRSGSWDVYVMSVDGGQAVQVSSDPAHELHPSWSPDGRRLVYCRLGESSGRWEMWVSDTDQPQSSEFIGYGLFPSWCPVAGTGERGRDKILFQRSRERGDRAFSVWTIDYKPGDASSPTEVASSQVSAVINPSWSPDGTRIVFATVPFGAAETGAPGAKPISTDLWMAGVNGSGRVNLTAGKSVNLMPVWSSDGRIYFVSDRAGVENIWSIGTEKAIAAATGSVPMNTAQKAPPAKPGEVATAPTHE